MKKALSLLITLSAIGAATSIGAFLFALCQRTESDLVSKMAFVFVIFAPTGGMLLTLVLHSKIGLPWLAAPMGAVACAAIFGFTGYFTEWATELAASKSLTRSFWAIYWVGGFTFSAIYVFQAKSLWRLTFSELMKSRSSPHSQLRGADAPRRG